MKQTFTLLLAAIISTGLYAKPFSSKISISSTSNAQLRVMIDGNRYQANNNAVMVNNLQQGYHSVKVYRYVNNRFNSPVSNNNYQLVYSSNVYIKPQYHIDITINRFGKAFIDEQPMNAGYYDNNDDWNNNNWNDNNWNDNNWNNNNNDWNNRVINTQSFDRFKESLRNESFDNTRINIAKQVMGTNYFTTAQVKEILQFFSFESSRLDIAKYGYKNTVDKQDYFSVADCFTFSSNKDELMRYIQQYR